MKKRRLCFFNKEVNCRSVSIFEGEMTMRGSSPLLVCSLLFLGFSSVAVADDPLPAPEVLFREAHRNVQLVESLEFQQVVEFTTLSGVVCPIHELHYRQNKDDIRIDAKQSFASVKSGKIDETTWIRPGGRVTYQGDSVSIERVTESKFPTTSPNIRNDIYRWVIKGLPNETMVFKNWKTWQRHLATSRTVRRDTHRGLPVFVVQIGEGTAFSREVWFVRHPVCLPVLVARTGQGGPQQIDIDVEDFEVVDTNQGAVGIPTRINNRVDVTRILNGTLHVNEPIPSEVFQLSLQRVHSLRDLSNNSLILLDGTLTDIRF